MKTAVKKRGPETELTDLEKADRLPGKAMVGNVVKGWGTEGRK